MTSIPIVLKKDKRGAWNLHAPKGHIIGGPFKGNEFDALAWGRSFVSSWYNMTVVQEKNGGCGCNSCQCIKPGDDNAQKD